MRARGHNSHDNGSFHWSHQPREARPVEVKYVEENIGENQKYADDISRPPNSRGMNWSQSRWHPKTSPRPVVKTPRSPTRSNLKCQSIPRTLPGNEPNITFWKGSVVVVTTDVG